MGGGESEETVNGRHARSHSTTDRAGEGRRRGCGDARAERLRRCAAGCCGILGQRASGDRSPGRHGSVCRQIVRGAGAPDQPGRARECGTRARPAHRDERDQRGRDFGRARGQGDFAHGRPPRAGDGRSGALDRPCPPRTDQSRPAGAGRGRVAGWRAVAHDGPDAAGQSGSRRVHGVAYRAGCGPEGPRGGGRSVSGQSAHPARRDAGLGRRRGLPVFPAAGSTGARAEWRRARGRRVCGRTAGLRRGRRAPGRHCGVAGHRHCGPACRNRADRRRDDAGPDRGVREIFARVRHGPDRRGERAWRRLRGPDQGRGQAERADGIPRRRDAPDDPHVSGAGRHSRRAGRAVQRAQQRPQERDGKGRPVRAGVALDQGRVGEFRAGDRRRARSDPATATRRARKPHQDAGREPERSEAASASQRPRHGYRARQDGGRARLSASPHHWRAGGRRSQESGSGSRAPLARGRRPDAPDRAGTRPASVARQPARQSRPRAR